MPTLKIEKDEDEILVAYLQFTTGPIARTVEIERNKILVDEDAEGGIVGIELLFPKNIGAAVRLVSERYNNPGIAASTDELLAVC